LVSEEIKEALFLSREARVLQSRGMKNEALLCRELPGEKMARSFSPARQLSYLYRFASLEMQAVAIKEFALNHCKCERA
tara:strand:- start:37 stop:273 length:237 start_codon:yes stop_codon:yes gene_type:complete